MSRRISPMPVQLDERGLYVFESRHSDAFTMRFGQWDFHKLGVIEDGRGELQTHDRQWPLEPYDCLYIPPRVTHRFADHAQSPLTLMMVCFTTDVLAKHAATRSGLRLLEQRCPQPTVIPLKATHQRRDILHGYQTMIFEQSRRHDESAMIVLSETLRLIANFLRAQQHEMELQRHNSTDHRIVAALEFLHTEFIRPITVDDLAAIAQLSYRRFTYRFKQYTGSTVHQYLADLRIGYAKERLRASGNILHSAMQAGFSDLGHFYRMFKRHTGMTPRMYIENERQGDQGNQDRIRVRSGS